jgi:hypothetical protein
VSDPVSAKSISELRGMSEEDLIAAHNWITGLSASVETADNY